jgi:4-hydroxybenzoyl-CoA thioesterase
MSYLRRVQIEFNHCDPAGIVFYPRYLEMVNSVVENFFIEVVGHSFARMMAEGAGVPTAHLAVAFRAPSRLEERLDFALSVTRVGRTSVGLRIVAHGAGVVRLEADLVLVWMQGGAPQPWPEATRARLVAAMEAEA